MGPVYIFGYSNGGFMAYYLACKGLPGLRAVASLAGTSYMDDAACDGSPPVSVLHIHGTDDAVVLFDGVEGEPGAEGRDGLGYAGAEDMFHRWGERAGCNVQSVAYGLGVDLDDDIEGPETLTFAFPEGCAEGITVEMWSSDEGGPTPPATATPSPTRCWTGCWRRSERAGSLYPLLRLVYDGTSKSGERQ